MSDIPREGETPPMIGSVMLGYAESKEELLKRLKDDIYTTGDVWDWNKVRYYPSSHGILLICSRCKYTRSRVRSGRDCKSCDSRRVRHVG